jgi:hypothetical protein
MTRTTHTTSKKTTKASEELVAWTATEAVPRPRWWLFVIVGYFGPVLTVIFLIVGNWSVALLLAVFTVLFFIVYLPRPKVWTYGLVGTTLTATREHRRGNADEKTIDLTQYHSIDVRPLTSRRCADQSQLVLTLWPKKRFASDIDVYVPESAQTVQRALRDAIANIDEEH